MNENITIPILDDFTNEVPPNNQSKKVLTQSDYIDCCILSYLSCYNICPDQSCWFDICKIESYTAQVAISNTNNTKKITPRKSIQIKQINCCCFGCLFRI
jgi:hypothetical protein